MSEVEEQDGYSWRIKLPGLFWPGRRTRVQLLGSRGSSGRVEDPSRGVSVSACPFGRGTGLETNEVARLFKGAKFLEPRLGETQSRAPPAARIPVPVLGREAGRRSGEAPAAERCWAGPDAAARAPSPPVPPPRPPARALRPPAANPVPRTRPGPWLRPRAPARGRAGLGHGAAVPGLELLQAQEVPALRRSVHADTGEVPL